LEKYTSEPRLQNGELKFEEGSLSSLNESILRSAAAPFSPEGGIKVLKGNIGTAVIKTSAVDEENLVIEAEAVVFDDQDDLIKAFKNNELNKDFVAVIPFQGPKHKGMPELHKLTPSLTILQKRGYKVGLVTDGRMSGASGKVPSAIHLYPEASEGGIIAKIRTGDLIRLDAKAGELMCLESDLELRDLRTLEYNDNSHGRDLFTKVRSLIENGEKGAGII